MSHVATTAVAVPYKHQLDDGHPSVPFAFLSTMEKRKVFISDTLRERGIARDVIGIMAEYFLEHSQDVPLSLPPGSIHYTREKMWEMFKIRMLPIDVTDELRNTLLDNRIIIPLSPTVLVCDGNEWKEVPLTLGLIMKQAIAAGMAKWSGWSYKKFIEAIQNIPVKDVCTIAVGQDLVPGSSTKTEKEIQNIIKEQRLHEPLPPAIEMGIAMLVHYCATKTWLFNGDYVLTNARINKEIPISLGGIVSNDKNATGLCISGIHVFGAGLLRKFLPPKQG